MNLSGLKRLEISKTFTPERKLKETSLGRSVQADHLKQKRVFL